MTTEKKYTHSDELQKLINWPVLDKLEREAGGHDAQMRYLLKSKRVIALVKVGTYTGNVAACVELHDGRIVIYNDWYGSCSGCDAWEGASDESARRMCINLANGAMIFQNIQDVTDFLDNLPEDKSKYDWEELDEDDRIADKLSEAIKINWGRPWYRLKATGELLEAFQMTHHLYHNRPLAPEWIQFAGSKWSDENGALSFVSSSAYLKVPHLDDPIEVPPGSWIFKDGADVLHMASDEVFNLSFEKVQP